MTAAARRTRFRVEGMDCANCVAKIDKAVRRISYMTDVKVLVVAGTMSVEHANKLDLDVPAQKVNRLSYKATGLDAVKGSKTIEQAGAEELTAGHSHHSDAGHEQGPNCSHDHSAHVHGEDCKHEHASDDDAGPILQGETPRRFLAVRRQVWRMKHVFAFAV